MPRFNLLPTIALMVMLLVTSGCRIHSDSQKDFSAQAPRSYAEGKVAAESTNMAATGSAIGESAPSGVMAASSPEQTKPTIANVLSTAFKRLLRPLYDIALSLPDPGVWLLVFVLPIALVIGFVLFLVGKSLRPVYQKATTALKHRLKPTKPSDK